MNDSVVVEHLTVEYQRDPVPLGVERPRFGWHLRAPGRRGVRQRAYEIAVSTRSSPHDPDGAVWRSGRVADDRSVAVPYQGPPLRSRTRYAWAVRVWVDDGEPTAWSGTASWETGLRPEDWQARWIEPVQRPAGPGPERSPDELMGLVPTAVQHDALNPAQYIRRRFTVRAGLTRARVHATAHGVYTAEVNGQRLGDQELAPEPTSYEGLLLHQTYDATALVREGDNAIGFIVADGWWAGRLGLSGRPANYGDTLGLLAQIELHYRDGTTEVVASDDTFRASTGAVVYADLLVGEKVDARREPVGWTTAEFDDSGWSAVIVTDAPLDNVVPHLGEPVRTIAELPARAAHDTADGGQVLDFGQIVTGRVRLQLDDLEAGTEIRLEHFQLVDGDGDAFDSIAGTDNENLDVYVARGGGEEVFEPRHTFHGFRYVKITGLPRPVAPARATAVALSSDVSSDFSLRASDPRIERLQEVVRWTLRDNLVSIPMDNPDRERAGWTGDFAAVLPTAAVNLGLDAFVTRYLSNLAVEQFDDGTVPMVVPYWASYRETMTAFLGTASSAAWGDVAVVAPWTAYRTYGDARLLDQHYETLRRFLAHVTQEAAASVSTADEADPDLAAIRRAVGFHFGDWLTPSTVTLLPSDSYDGSHGVRTAELIPTLYYLRSTDTMAEIAHVLGHDADEAAHRELAARLRRGFRKAFVQEGGRLTLDTQGNYVLALAFRAAPDLDALFAGRLRELVLAAGGRLDTGFLSTAFLLPVLTEHGLNDLAHALLLSPRCPSWMHMLDHGATTVWEMWNAVEEDGTPHRVSFAQPALASVGVWLVEHLAGIRPARPGYEHIELHPVPGPGLDWAEGRYRSVRGEIVCRWERRGDAVRLDATIPANASATIVLEGALLPEVRLDGAAVTDHADVAAAAQDGGRVTVEVGSGQYSLRYPHHPTAEPTLPRTRATELDGTRGRHDLTGTAFDVVAADPDVRALIERIAPELPRQPLIALSGRVLPFELALRLAQPQLGRDRVEALRREIGALA